MLTQLKPEVMPFDQFAAGLQSVCGAFEVVPPDDRTVVQGHVSAGSYAGLDMAMIAKDVQRTRRTEADVKRNPGEYVFLIVQEEGQSLMQQAGTTTMMTPGDMILIDSTLPSEFTFFGKYMRHLSLHLSRAELRQRFGDISFSGRSIRAQDRHAIALSAIIGSAFRPETSDTQSGFLKEAIFGVLGAALYEQTDPEQSRHFDADINTAQILERASAMIDRCFADSTLTPGCLAEQMGISIRHLQRAFACIGLTPTDYLMRRRLEKACRLLEERKRSGAQTLVSTIAYQCGFNDVSYFNRQFRRAFDCSPGQYPLDT
ncbi:MAG: helix-turn-helix domain-containing protein [Pseudomonadota bacterium]|nr:helix-turn-helix domain-containing protein [Pseudomonadota bacterium]